MKSSSPTYHEDYHSLQGMIGHFEFSEELIREIQKHGLILPETVKFGSAEIEIYSKIDENLCRRIKEALDKYSSLSQAIAAAQAHVVKVYRVARGEGSTDLNDSPDLRQEPGLQRKKLYLINELLDAVDIGEEQFREIGQHIQFVPLRLLIPGKSIEYYGEDDYLRLQYIVTLIGQGCSLEEAVGVAYDWGVFEM